MEGFVTLDMFLSFAFCVTAVTVLVQLIKKKVTKIDTWIILLVVSTAVMAINFVVKEDFSWKGILTAIVNIIVVAIASSGSYEGIVATYKAIKGKANKK